jgi:hypothetical protein
MSSLKTIRAAVCRRAEGKCEHCGIWVGENGEEAHADHAHGRGKGRPPESTENVWLLCVPCDARKTESKPSAAYWLVAFLEHCRKHKLPTKRTEDRLAFVQARAALRGAA